ncbi:MAG TPA: phosphate ABC transporter permease PstA [Acidimicrobiales bacterium]|nr:phosphate ABC transporter permease PstA [Acidimicrobiales bacterium]
MAGVSLEAQGATPDDLLTDAAGRAAGRGRRIVDGVGWGLGYLALVAIAGPVVWVLAGVFARALPHWQWKVLWTTGAAGTGGLLNEIVGSLLLLLGVAILAGAVGLGTGIYLAEYSKGRLGGFLRTASEVLAGIPSIVLGYVGYIAFVVTFHWSFSLLAGLITLTLMGIPYTAKSTELALRQVPTGYREGADALGMPAMHALRHITLRTALPGIATGLLVALALSLGETAPLLYTAGFTSSLPSLQLTHAPVAYLTYAVWTFYNQPSPQAVDLSYDAAVILVVLLLIILVVSRLVVGRSQRYSETGGR